MNNVIPIKGKTADTLAGKTAAFPIEPGHCAQADPAKQEAAANKLLELGDRASHFQRLEKAFQAKGWCLYPLSGDTLMVTIPQWGMSRVLPDLRTAQLLLRQIGGC